MNGGMKMNVSLMFSSEKDNWETPNDLFKELNDEFKFNLDPCATNENAKCDKYYTINEDGLMQDWGGYNVFCNPPYGKEIKKWVKKCYDESKKENTKVVLLIPARTDTSYFHDYIYEKAKEVRFIRGRLKFSNNKYNAPFPSMIIVF